jgi:hypothetical protein
MKLRLAFILTTFAALSLLAAACAPTALVPGTPDVLAPTEVLVPTDSPTQPKVRAVQVQSVNIQVLPGTPAGAAAVVHGNLGESCAALQSPQVQYASGTFQITLMAESPAGAACTQLVTPFETTIPLATNGLPAGNYTVTVNGVSGVFTLAADPTAVIPAPTATNVPAPTSVGCTDAAAFVSDVSIPDNARITPGSEFIKIWRLRNSGTCSWNSSYMVSHVDGASLTDSAEYTLTGGRVDPGQTVDINVGMRAPTASGTYTSYWALRGRDRQLVPVTGGHDGNQFFVKIRVGEAANNATGGKIIAYSVDAVVTKGTACTADAEYKVTASFTADGPVNVGYEVTSTSGNAPAGYFLSDIDVQAATVQGPVVLGAERFSHGEGPQALQFNYRFGAPYTNPNDITFMVRVAGSAWHTTKLPCP